MSSSYFGFRAGYEVPSDFRPLKCGVLYRLPTYFAYHTSRWKTARG